MDNFSYCTPTKYVFGRDAELHVADELKAIDLNNVLVCYGGGSVVRSGLLQRVLQKLDEAGIAHTELGCI